MSFASREKMLPGSSVFFLISQSSWLSPSPHHSTQFFSLKRIFGMAERQRPRKRGEGCAELP